MVKSAIMVSLVLHVSCIVGAEKLEGVGSCGRFSFTQVDPTTVSTLDPVYALLTTSYYTRNQDASMAAMNKECGIPTTSDFYNDIFRRTFTLDDLQSGNQLLFEAVDTEQQKIAAVLYLFRQFAGSAEHTGADHATTDSQVTAFELGFIAVDPALWQQGLSLKLLSFGLAKTNAAKVITPARPTNEPFIAFLQKTGFQADQHLADQMRQAILQSAAPDYEKNLARNDLSAYVLTCKDDTGLRSSTDIELKVTDTVLGMLSAVWDSALSWFK